MKFALVSHVLPPSWSGQAVMIYRLLRNLTGSEYCLISRQRYSDDDCHDAYVTRLSGTYCHIPPLRAIAPRGRLHTAAPFKAMDVLVGVVSRGRQIANIIRQEGCHAVVACTGDLLDPPAAYLAGRIARVPYYAYVFDYYSFQWLNAVDLFFAQRFEPIMLKGATGVIVTNEFLREEYYRRFGIAAAVIHNPCDALSSGGVTDVPWPVGKGEIRIVYTGAVYHAQYDAFHNLIAALRLLGRPELKLHIYTAQPREHLERHGICGPVVHHVHTEQSEMARVQEEADILFLPLAFDSPIPRVIRTSAPGKMGEYLASGGPVLAHAPADSFVSWYFRQNRCGLVVDEKAPEVLAEAISRIAADSELRTRLRESARQCANKDFSADAASSTFLNLVRQGR